MELKEFVEKYKILIGVIIVLSLILLNNQSYEIIPIDPKSETFEQDAIKFAKNYLRQYCGEVCTNLNCGPICAIYDENTGEVVKNEWDDRCIRVVFAHDGKGRGVIDIACDVMTNWKSTQTPCNIEADCDWYWGHCYRGMCVTQLGSDTPWRMEFFEGGEIPISTSFTENNYCYNAEAKTKCTHQSICDYYIEKDGSADWCVGDLPLNILNY